MKHHHTPLLLPCIFILALSAFSFLGCNKGRETTTGTNSKIVGKWQRTYTSPYYLGQIVAEMEFFGSGDFSQSETHTGTNTITRNAGTYKFIDANHLKLDYGIEANIYELVSVSDKELKLKHEKYLEVWTRP
jgi:hypothetical protein